MKKLEKYPVKSSYFTHNLVKTSFLNTIRSVVGSSGMMKESDKIVGFVVYVVKLR
jgi:hypothetical protein